MKQCVHCKEFKELSEFAWNNKLLKKRQKHCRDCMRKFNRASYLRRSEAKKEQVRDERRRKYEEARQYIWDYLLGHPCTVYGESDPVVLEFHHVAGSKRENVTNMPRDGYSLESIKKEMGKCEVLCANCHRRRTGEGNGWFRG